MRLPEPILQPVSDSVWQVAVDYVCPSPVGKVHIRAGFCTDGASVPRACWWWEGPMEGDTLPAAVVHDALYAAHWTTRAEADGCLYSLLRGNGVSTLKAWAMHAAVRLFGGSAWAAATAATIDAARQLVTIERVTP